MGGRARAWKAEAPAHSLVHVAKAEKAEEHVVWFSSQILVSHGQPVRGVHHPSQICDENHKFVTGLARFSVFCVEFSDNLCATQTQKEFWDFAPLTRIGLGFVPIWDFRVSSPNWNGIQNGDPISERRSPYRNGDSPNWFPNRGVPESVWGSFQFGGQHIFKDTNFWVVLLMSLAHTNVCVNSILHSDDFV